MLSWNGASQSFIAVQHPHAPQPLLYILDVFQQRWPRDWCMHILFFLCTHVSMYTYVRMFTVPIVYFFCYTLLHGLPLVFNYSLCAETWKWHWCCVPPLFSAYCLSQSLRVSDLECCISTFLPYNTEEVVKDSCHTVLTAGTIWRWLQSIKLWLSKSLYTLAWLIFNSILFMHFMNKYLWRCHAIAWFY